VDCEVTEVAGDEVLQPMATRAQPQSNTATIATSLRTVMVPPLHPDTYAGDVTNIEHQWTESMQEWIRRRCWASAKTNGGYWI